MSARVLVVDDMAIYRSVISRAVNDAPDLELAGQAGSGKDALDAIVKLTPDLVTLDLEMPDMDGIAVLKGLAALPRSVKRPVVVVFSSHSADGASITIKALALGAAEFILKPTSSDGMSAITDKLIPRLQALAQPSVTMALNKRQVKQVDRTTRRRVLAIASSTGGPKALEEALVVIPKPPPVPLLIVQHMPPVFTKVMAEHLSKLCKFSVVEAEDGMAIEPGIGYVAPGDWHMTVSNRLRPTIHLNQSDRLVGLRPAADILFPSVSEIFAGAVLGCVFTGMGQDGAAGSRALHNIGAAIISQSRQSCVVYGMPQAIDELGIADDHFTPETFWRVASSFNLQW